MQLRRVRGSSRVVHVWTSPADDHEIGVPLEPDELFVVTGETVVTVVGGVLGNGTKLKFARILSPRLGSRWLLSTSLSRDFTVVVK